MDDNLLSDIRRAIEDGIECEDWKCIEEALEMIKDFQGDYDDDIDSEY